MTCSGQIKKTPRFFPDAFDTHIQRGGVRTKNIFNDFRRGCLQKIIYIFSYTGGCNIMLHFSIT